MEKFGFFDAIMEGGEPDRVYSADDMNNIFAGLISDGVYKGYENELLVSPGAGLSVDIDTGKAMANKHWYTSNAVQNLTLNAAHPTLDRYTTVVVRCDSANRVLYLDLVDGDPGEDPVPQELIQDEDEYDVRIADIYVRAGATELTADDITNTRQYAKGLVDAPDVNLRRYDTVVLVPQGISTVNIPEQYKLTAATKLQVYSNGLLMRQDEYSLGVNESAGLMCINFVDERRFQCELSFIMTD